MVVPVGLGIRVPDVAETLDRAEAWRANRLAQLVNQRALAQREALGTALAQHGGALFSGDPTRQMTALEALVRGGGPEALPIAMPFWQAARQPNPTRERNVGAQVVTEEFDPATRTWRVIGAAPRWQPQQPTPWQMVERPDGVYAVNPRDPTQVRRVEGVPGAQPNAPAGYRWNARGQLEPIPGGPAEFIIQEVRRPDGTIDRVAIPRAELSGGVPAAPPQPSAQGGGPTPGSRVVSSQAPPPASAEAGARIALVREGMAAVRQAEQMLFRNGNFDRSLAASAWVAGNVPGAGGLTGAGQLLRNALGNAIANRLRIESGAALTAQEVENMMQRYMPQPTDTEETARQKLRSLEQYFREFEQAVRPGRGGPELAPPEEQRRDGIPPPPAGFEIVR